MPEAAWRRRFRATRVSRPSWARDAADRLLYTSNATGKRELYVWDRRGGVHRRITDRPEGTSQGGLDPTGEAVWWFDDERGNELGRWMVEPFAETDAGHPRPAAELPPAYSTGLALGRRFAVVGSSDDEGTRVDLVRPGAAPARLYAHREDAEVGGLSRDETLLALDHSEHGDSRHPALRILDLDGWALADLWDGTGRGLWALEWSPVPGDERLLVLHERQDIPRPLIWNPVTNEVVQPKLDLPGEVEADWYPDGRALLLSHDYRGRVELYRYPLPGGPLVPLGVERGTAFAAAVRPDGEIWYEWTSSAEPYRVMSDDQVLLSPPGEPAPRGVPYAEHMAGDVPIFVAEPPSARPHPTLFLIHGGPTHHDRDVFSPMVQAFVDHGLAVVLVNYRGSTGYGRAWRDALEGNPGLTELEDVAKAHDWAVGSGVADVNRTVLAGYSWGGYLTLLGLGTQPGRWALGIAGVPVADYVAAFEDEMEPLKAFDRSLFGGSPEQIPEFYRERSPITYVDRVRVPVLVLAGENDPRCPIRQIDNYLARLQTLGKPYEVYRFEAGHGSLVVEEQIRQMEVNLTFLAKHLGTKPPE